MTTDQGLPPPPTANETEDAAEATTEAAFRSGRASQLAGVEPLDPSAATMPGVPPAAAGGARPVSDEASSDRYRFREVLGTGGMGRVLLAWDQDIDRPVAVKTLRAKLKQSELAKRRFLEEVRVAGRLEHPAIMPVHDVGTDAEGSPYYTMRYLRGETARDLIKRLKAGDEETHARWPFERRLQLVLQVLSALDHAHAAGVVHRDLKPDNIMVGASGEVFVIDWGLATLDDESGLELLRGRRLEGTPRYMSPEQARKENADLDQRSDLYSLCAVLYELLTLRCHLGDLSDAKSAEDVAARVCEHTPAPAETLTHPAQPRVPRSLSLLLEKGLAHDREARFQTAAELRDELNRWLEGSAPVVCAHTGMIRLLRTLVRWTDEHDRLMIYGGVLFAAFALLGVWTAARMTLALVGADPG